MLSRIDESFESDTVKLPVGRFVLTQMQDMDRRLTHLSLVRDLETLERLVEERPRRSMHVDAIPMLKSEDPWLKVYLFWIMEYAQRNGVFVVIHA